MDLRFEKIMSWLMDRLPVYLMWFVVVLLILVVGVQVGIHKGKKLQIEVMSNEQRAMSNELKAAEEKLKELEDELEHQKLIRAIAKCESNFRHENTWGDGGRSYGMFQFKKPSFIFLTKKMGFLNGNWKNKEHQILVASWAIKNNYGHLWTCYRKIKKAGFLLPQE